MNELRTEEEQLAALKGWWMQYGTLALLGVVLVGGSYFGWQGWKDHQQKQAQEAHAIYVSLQEAIVNASSVTSGQLFDADVERIRAVNFRADELQNSYAGTQFAVLGAIAAARSAADRADYIAATARLDWALANSKDDATRQLVSYRLALVVHAQGEDGRALGLLRGEDDSFRALYAEARGDIHRANGRLAEARTEYEAARLALLPDQASYAPMLDRKIYDVSAGVALSGRD